MRSADRQKTHTNLQMYTRTLLMQKRTVSFDQNTMNHIYFSFRGRLFIACWPQFLSNLFVIFRAWSTVIEDHLQVFTYQQTSLWVYFMGIVATYTLPLQRNPTDWPQKLFFTGKKMLPLRSSLFSLFSALGKSSSRYITNPLKNN